jgi:hypothetical protein
LGFKRDRMSNVEPMMWLFTMAVAVIGAIWLAVRSVRWAKKGTKGGAMLVALAFPNPDRPPPQQQVEEQTRRKKDSESGDPPE